VKLWIDAQLSPAIAAWINRSFGGLEASSARALGLRQATDLEFFWAARDARAVVMSKDADFGQLLERYGPPPQVLWVTCGNTSNRRMREILAVKLEGAIARLARGESLVEISEGE
jgi:predicted nuclease of predicted toxin-antitoxin system